jgi:hypothetical protein
MDYYQGYEDAIRQTKVTRSTGLIGFFIRTIISVLYSAFVYVPLIMLSYFVANKLSGLYSNDIYIKIGLTVITGYLLFSFIYFLKGILIGMRNAGHKMWVVVWLFCVIVTCGIQAVVGQSLLEEFFASRQIANYQLWSWVGGGAIVVLIYTHYQFLTNIAPSVVFWIYRLGFRTMPQLNFKSISVPKKSATYFDNAPMRVSFKK